MKESFSILFKEVFGLDPGDLKALEAGFGNLDRLVVGSFQSPYLLGDPATRDPDARFHVDFRNVYSTVLQVMSAALADPFREEGWTDAFRDLVAQLANQPSFARLTEELREMQAEVSTAALAWYGRAKVS